MGVAPARAREQPEVMKQFQPTGPLYHFKKMNLSNGWKETNIHDDNKPQSPSIAPEMTWPIQVALSAYPLKL